MKTRTILSACLFLPFLFSIHLQAQTPYGNNPQAGHFVQSDDARIYYEVYGSGQPLLLIHGSLYGYISEFEQILPTLIANYKVIAVALRGHGKSGIGDQEYSYGLFAEDMIDVLDAENIDRAHVMGFSAGAITAVKLAADFPERVLKVVSIAGALGPDDHGEVSEDASAESFVASNKNFVEQRQALMPEPERFAEFYDKLIRLGHGPAWISDQDASQISAPLLVVGGDSDSYFPVEAFLRMHSVIPGSRLLILPKNGHVDALLNRAMYVDFALPFLEEE
ncbi:MAG: alpha/beta hydrolase [Bacteroidales bacterium]